MICQHRASTRREIEEIGKQVDQKLEEGAKQANVEEARDRITEESERRKESRKQVLQDVLEQVLPKIDHTIEQKMKLMRKHIDGHLKEMSSQTMQLTDLVEQQQEEQNKLRSTLDALQSEIEAVKVANVQTHALMEVRTSKLHPYFSQSALPRNEMNSIVPGPDSVRSVSNGRAKKPLRELLYPKSSSRNDVVHRLSPVDHRSPSPRSSPEVEGRVRATPNGYVSMDMGAVSEDQEQFKKKQPNFITNYQTNVYFRKLPPQMTNVDTKESLRHDFNDAETIKSTKNSGPHGDHPPVGDALQSLRNKYSPNFKRAKKSKAKYLTPFSTQGHPKPRPS